jgi:hypothetical protein
MNLFIFCQVSSGDVIFRLFRGILGVLLVKMLVVLIVKDGDNKGFATLTFCVNGSKNRVCFMVVSHSETALH